MSISTTAFGPYFERLRIQAQGDDLPDVFWINGPNFELYASHEMLQDLSELEGFDPANYPPNLVELYSFESSAFGTFLMRQHYLGMPRSLEEAARLDGASPWQTFWRIMFPLSGPALSAVAILTALASWNDLMWPLIVATYDVRTTLAVGLSTLQGQFTTDYPVMMAAAFMAMLPLMILFIVLQRRVVEGLAHSGMKG
ncbi:ABC transporter permease subunit [Brachybacterium paraconglomeratum]|uniref:carbohydrate ABC transporter permease n=1 Tax=Brachybacterium TaxID=43668 RepID=UPI0021DF7278|nr:MULTISPECIES: ABC transporter permease subunit [Brachybacterium]WME23308.1 ABC transporter permease subunit [Brachybacterium sp. GU-2]